IVLPGLVLVSKIIATISSSNGKIALVTGEGSADSVHPLKLTRLATRALLGAKKRDVVVLNPFTVGLSWSYPAAFYCATRLIV
ncbi:unnamed protein product, partial [Aureobasidium mustum]